MQRKNRLSPLCSGDPASTMPSCVPPLSEDNQHGLLSQQLNDLQGPLNGAAPNRSDEEMAKHEIFKEHMEALRHTLPEVRGLLLASSEGLPIAHSLSSGINPHDVAAMAATASSLGRRIGDSLNVGNVFDISIHGEDGAIFFYSAGARAVLAVICPRGSNIGLINLEASATAKKISELFQPKGTRDSL